MADAGRVKTESEGMGEEEYIMKDVRTMQTTHMPVHPLSFYFYSMLFSFSPRFPLAASVYKMRESTVSFSSGD